MQTELHLKKIFRAYRVSTGPQALSRHTKVGNKEKSKQDKQPEVEVQVNG